jgi:hypothetical protein
LDRGDVAANPLNEHIASRTSRAGQVHSY